MRRAVREQEIQKFIKMGGRRVVSVVSVGGLFFRTHYEQRARASRG